jgi:hypothetical protein
MAEFLSARHFGGNLPALVIEREAGQPLAQTPEGHGLDAIARALGPAQYSCGALIELPTAIVASGPAVALGRALWPFRHTRRTAVQTRHLCPHPKRIEHYRGLLQRNRVRSVTLLGGGGLVPDVVGD